MAEWAQVDELFQRAIDLPLDERAGFLDTACVGDAELRHEIDALLAAADVEFPKPVSSETIAAAIAIRRSELAPGARLGAYVLVAPIASGGMGTVWRARRADTEFEREVAIKVLKPAHDLDGLVERFTQERRTLARLEHPNIARLYDAGATPSGLPYLVLELVDGKPIDAHCDERRASVRERLELFAQVAAGVHAAHQMFVVHRDIKPSNILVGRDGVPKIVDFGIAKHVDEDAARAPQITRTGVRPMTPRYASPEQVRGDPITTASDVYSLGVVLYELVCGAPPYAGDTTSAREIETAILESRPHKPSTVVRRLSAHVPATDATRPSEQVISSSSEIAERRAVTPRELVKVLKGDVDAISLCALRKDPRRRYASAEAFAADVRRHLAGLPVLARPDALRDRIAKFVKRQRLVTAVAALSAIAIAISIRAYVRSATLARERLEDVLRLSDLARLDDFGKEADQLWPALPAIVPKYDDWLLRAREVSQNLPRHRATLDALRSKGTLAGERVLFTDVATQWQHDKTAELVSTLERFVDRDKGLIADVERRREFASTLEQRSVGDHAAEWARARRSIADRAESPQYGGLDLAPIVGLVPVGRDSESKLWEFAHLATGEIPVRDSDGKLIIGRATAVVLVLIPGGTFNMGAQVPRDGEVVTNPDPLARDIEGPVHAVTLAPFFIGKYEMTQGQWLRADGSNPSSIKPDQKHGSQLTSLANPVETISFRDVQRVLPRIALSMPTEAQWEYAARAGTTTPWWTGADRESLRGVANLADGSAAKAGAPWVAIRDWPELEDGHVVTAKVDTLRANPFGLHHVHGNVWELCADGFISYGRPTRAGDGWRLIDEEPKQCVGRGGCFVQTAAVARVTNRGPGVWTQKDETIGVRVARAIE